MSRTDTYFFTSSTFGGGSGFRLSGLGALVPSPTCSQGESDSKFLIQTFSNDKREGQYNIPESLSELKRLIDNAFTFFIISNFGVALTKDKYKPHR